MPTSTHVWRNQNNTSRSSNSTSLVNDVYMTNQWWVEGKERLKDWTLCNKDSTPEQNPEKHQIRCATAIQTLWASRPQAHRGFSSLVLKLSSAFLGSAWGWHFGDGTTGARPFPKGRFGQGGEGGWNELWMCCLEKDWVALNNSLPLLCNTRNTRLYYMCDTHIHLPNLVYERRKNANSIKVFSRSRWIWLNVPVVKLTDRFSRPWRDCRVDSEMQAKTGVWSRSNNPTTSFFSANGFVLVPCAVYSSSEANITAFLNRQECLIKGLQAHISFLQELLTGDGCQALTFEGVLGIDWYAHWHISRLRCWPKSARGVMNSCSFWRRSP